jgi:hypothetical protein
MAMVPYTQMQLLRERKQFEQQVSQQNWDEIALSDARLMSAVTCAAEDSDKDLGLLLAEMKEIVSTYRNLLDSCSEKIAHGLKQSL